MAKTSDGNAHDPNGAALGALERTLAAVFVGIIALTVVAFLVLMIGSAGAWLDEQAYALLLTLVLFGLPVALVIMLVLTVRLAIRRARDNRRR